jgi:aspartyl-tRNA(Asn)/glutamyl-tRNA(Gln) amidotransferase subunit C
MINEKEVERIAELGYLKMSKEEIKKYTQELSRIMDFFKILQKIDTKNVEPLLGSSELEDVIREDNSRISSKNQKIVGGAPQKKDSYIKTKAVFS